MMKNIYLKLGFLGFTASVVLLVLHLFGRVYGFPFDRFLWIIFRGRGGLFFIVAIPLILIFIGHEVFINKKKTLAERKTSYLAFVANALIYPFLIMVIPFLFLAEVLSLSTWILSSLGVLFSQIAVFEMFQSFFYAHPHQIKSFIPIITTDHSKAEQAIEYKLKELTTHEQNIREIQKRIIQENKTKELESVVADMEQAISFIHDQRNIYELQMWANTQTAWLNGIKPITEHWYDIKTQADCDKSLKKVQGIVDEGNHILQHWKDRRDLVTIPKGEQYVKNFNMALESCAHLTTQLLAKKAHLAIKNLPVDQSNFIEQEKDPFEQLYKIMAVVEVEQDELHKIERDIQNKLSELESRKEIQEMFQ